MRSTNDCPLCTDTYETETDLHVHLEVEHRKSELALYVVEYSESTGDPIVERTQSQSQPTQKEEAPSTPL